MKKIKVSDLWELRVKYLYELMVVEKELGIDNYVLKEADRITDSFIRWILAELLEE